MADASCALIYDVYTCWQCCSLSQHNSLSLFLSGHELPNSCTLLLEWTYDGLVRHRWCSLIKRSRRYTVRNPGNFDVVWGKECDCHVYGFRLGDGVIKMSRGKERNGRYAWDKLTFFSWNDHFVSPLSLLER